MNERVIGMQKWKKTVWLCWCALLLAALCGCAGGEAPAEVSQNDTPSLLVCYDEQGMLIFNTEGKLLLKTGGSGNDEYVEVSFDDNGRGTGFVCQEVVRETVETSDAALSNMPAKETIYTFYDVYGNELKQVDIKMTGDVTLYQSNGSLEDCRFLVYEEGSDVYRILDENGGLLLERQLAEREGLASNYVVMTYNGQLMAVTYDLHDDNWNNWEAHCEVFASDGTELTLAHDYTNMGRQWDEVARWQSNYLVAEYQPAPGVTMIDILNPDGTVLVAELNNIMAFGGGVIVCQQGSTRGAMDMQGNWLYQESLYADLDD